MFFQILFDYYIYDYFYEFGSEALHIVIFENFVKSMTSCLSKLKVAPKFYFPFKISDDPTASIIYLVSVIPMDRKY